MSRILVTDDDPEQRELRKQLLESAGHQVALAAGSPATLRHLEHEHPDLLIMDLRLPNPGGEPDPREGLALIRRIRQVDRRMPVIVLSGWPEDLYGAPEERMVSRVVVKPVGCRDLLNLIDELTS